MKKTIKIIMLLTFELMFSVCVAQNTPISSVKTKQPKIMVIPMVKEGEDLRTIIEADFNKRVAMTTVKDAFDKQGFSTTDARTKIKGMSNNAIYTSMSQKDFKTELIKNSGADIYVEVDMNILNSSNGNSVSLNLNANETSTFAALSNKYCTSGKFYTDDIAKLANKAIENCSAEFMETLQQKFNDIVENGQSVYVDFQFNESSDKDFNSEFGADGKILSDLIDEWMAENSYKNNYTLESSSDKIMIYSDVRIPLKDEKGKNYTTLNFRTKIINFLKGLGISAKGDPNFNSIHISIN